MKTIKERKKEAITVEQFTLTPPFPKEIFIDLTSFCNQRCIFCANRKLKNKRTMEHSLVMRILRESYENGTRDIGIYATGESFLVKNLAEYIKAAKKIGHEYIFITTNGALATPQRAKDVLDAGLSSIKFSINAGTRESYKKIHGTDDFDKVLANLRWISEYRKKSGLDYRIYVTMVYTDETKNEEGLLKNLVMPYIDEWDPHLLTNQCGNMYENNNLGKIEKDNARGRVKSNICFQPFKGFTVTPEGYMSACCIDYQKDLIIADLNKTTMKEAWTSEIYKDFRNRHIKENLEGLLCYVCMKNIDKKTTPLMQEYAEHFKDN